MTGLENHAVFKDVVERYRSRTRGSEMCAQRARVSLPGGDTRTASFHRPYPTFMVSGRGCRLTDADGNQYLDMLNNYTSMIHGHSHPEVTAAARAQIEGGTALCAPNQHQYLLAEHLIDRVPSIDQVRFCNSGTEATLFAIRAARAFTGKDAILKMDGGYHGSHDVARVNPTPDMQSAKLPGSFAEKGVPRSVIDEVVCAPFNDIEAVEAVIEANADRLAAVIVEPILGAGGLVPAEPGFLKTLRESTRKHRILLILDEIISLRLAYGGVQEQAAAEPDLTCLGKIIGGGFPVGAFGGRREIMSLYDPTRPDTLLHTGTFSGNNVTMAAGLKTMELFDRQSVERLNRLGEHLRQGFQQAFDASGLRGLAAGEGSLCINYWGGRRPQNAREAAELMQQHAPLIFLQHLAMMNLGVYTAPRGMYVLSTPMSTGDLDQAIGAFGEMLQTLRPLIEDAYPQLVAG